MELYDFLKQKGFDRLLDEPFMNPSHAGSSQTYEQLFEGYLKYWLEENLGDFLVDKPKTIIEQALIERIKNAL
jgi:hypothetical protein